MKKIYFLTTSLLLFFTVTVFSQTIISGMVTDENDEPMAGVNLIIKGRVIGTVADIYGKFSLSVNDNPPMILVASFIGYGTQEFEIKDAFSTGLRIKLAETSLLGQEIVISASRVEENIMESPVSIEKMDILSVQSTPADNYYKGLANLKGVDVTTSSINFQIYNTRGFGSTGNTRFVQLIDGMDTQAPALNFPIGNLNGPSELDVESVEMIPGASSALYGPNAFNGMILISSKSAFDYQGLSAFVKTGINHIKSDAPASPIWEGSIRYAKSFNNKFAFKVNASYMRANDWRGVSDTDREIERTPKDVNGNPLFTLTDGSHNPGSDRLHYMGDEASINLSIFPLSSSWRTFASTSSPFYNNIFQAGLTALNYADAGDLPNNIVSVTPYSEGDLIDYNAKNIKFSTGLYYRLNDKMEVSYLWNAGFGTSIYTGAQRYSLQNFGIQQHRLQLRATNFYVRAYTTIENSGDSYITEFMAKRVNDLATNSANPLFQDVSGYLATYGTEYLRYLYNQGLAPGQIGTHPQRDQLMEAAHNFARDRVDNGYTLGSINSPGMHLDPKSQKFKDIKELAGKGTVPNGPRFSDATRMYQAEGQYDFTNEIDFMELQAGGSVRMFDLRSNGTIFDDAAAPITIAEYGAYVQAGKWLGDRKVKLAGSVRYDKNQNFKGRVNPRIAAVFKVANDHNLRVSYQTGFRLPSTQGQHIDLSIISSRLLGGLPRYADKYQVLRSSTTTENLAFEGFSVQQYRNATFTNGNPYDQNNINLLRQFTWEPVKPEGIKSVEFGYKGLINNKLLVDLTYYYSTYSDFITQVRVVTAAEYTTDNALALLNPSKYSFSANPALAGTPNYATILNSTAHTIKGGETIGNTSQIFTNSTENVASQGFIGGLTYNLPKGYIISGNYNWNVLHKAPPSDQFLSEFNSPEHKINASFGNRKITDNLGFNVNMRWQTEFEWQSSFTIPANGMVPAYTTVDVQLSYKLPHLKSMLKIGGSNIMNEKYIQSFGGPNIGGLYYISLTYDEMFR